MPDKKKKENKKPKKTTAKDMPGSGMAKNAAKAIEERKKRMQNMLKNI